MKKTIFVGAGQAGNTLLYLLDKSLPEELKKEVDCVYVNLNMKDLQDRLIDLNPSGNRFFYLIEKQGTGREIREGIKLFSEDVKKFDALLRSIVDPQKYDEVVLVSSTGGGTGSSFTAYFLERLAEIQTLFTQPIRITLVLVYPFIDEPINFHANSFIFTQMMLTNLTKFANSKITLTIFPISNTKTQEKTTNASFEKINQYIQQVLWVSSFKLLTATKTNQEYFKTLDYAEYNKIKNIGKVFLVDENEITRIRIENENLIKKATRLHIIMTSPSKKADWYSDKVQKFIGDHDITVLAGEVNAPQIKKEYIYILSNITFASPIELFSILYETKVNYAAIIKKIQKVVIKDKSTLDNYEKVAQDINIPL